MDADTFDGIDSTGYLRAEPITMTQGGSSWIPTEVAPTTTERTAYSTIFSGDGEAVIGIAGPGYVGPRRYDVLHIELCWVLAGGAYIDRVEVGESLASQTTVGLSDSDDTDRTESGCRTYVAVSDPDVSGVGIRVFMAGGGTVELLGVRSTWE